MKSHTKIILVTLFLTLSCSCSPILNPYEENFKCTASDDIGECVDTTTAYHNARFPGPAKSEDTAEEQVQTGDIVPTQAPLRNHQLQYARYQAITEFLEEPSQPLLLPPKTLRVLMLPYEGRDGELFMPRYVYLQVEDARWLVTEQKEPLP
jgi:conjugal transfer pilus assembly protein TraV